MARPKRLPDGAEQVAVYLTPDQQLVLEVIRTHRKKRGESRTSTSEIVVDALLYLLEHDEKVSRKQVEQIAALAVPPSREAKVRLRPFLHKGK